MGMNGDAFITWAAASSSSFLRFSSCSRRESGRWPMVPIANACNFCSVIFYRVEPIKIVAQLQIFEQTEKKID